MVFFNLVAISCPVRSILQPPGWVLHARSSSRELACTGAKVKPNIWRFGWVHFFYFKSKSCQWSFKRGVANIWGGRQRDKRVGRVEGGREERGGNAWGGGWETRGVSGTFEQELNKIGGLMVGGREVKVRGSDEVSRWSSPAEKN